MQRFEIEPGIGVGPVKLGMTRQEVHDALGQPDWSREERDAFLGGFFVDFDKTGRAEFIELAKSKQFQAIFDGACLHDVPADTAVHQICKFDRFDETRRDLGHSYIFLNLQMSLWRGTIDGRYFEAIGIATPGYFIPGS